MSLHSSQIRSGPLQATRLGHGLGHPEGDGVYWSLVDTWLCQDIGLGPVGDSMPGTVSVAP
jgi:hypothetical protein